MEVKEITVTLKPGCDVTLMSNTPDLDGLVKEFVANKDTINPSEIEVNCSDDSFDAIGFQEVLCSAFEVFKASLQLEKEKFETEMEKLSDSSKTIEE